MRFTREFYTPKTPSNVIERQDLGGIVYLEDKYDRHFAIGFSGKRAKPDFNYRFKNENERKDYVDRYFKNLESRVNEKLNQKRQRAETTKKFLESLKPGVILYDTWGYEQTQVEFYKVIERKGSKVLIEEMGQQTVGEPTSWASDRVIPGNMTGKRAWFNVRGPCIRVDDSIALTVMPEEYMKTGLHRSWYY